MRNGVCWERQILVPPISENDVGFSERVPTPLASDWKRRGPNSKQKGLPEYVKQFPGSGRGGKLNPAWVEWLMGVPIGWTELNALATPKCHFVQPSLGKPCMNESMRSEEKVMA